MRRPTRKCTVSGSGSGAVISFITLFFCFILCSPSHPLVLPPFFPPVCCRGRSLDFHRQIGIRRSARAAELGSLCFFFPADTSRRVLSPRSQLCQLVKYASEYTGHRYVSVPPLCAPLCVVDAPARAAAIFDDAESGATLKCRSSPYGCVARRRSFVNRALCMQQCLARFAWQQ